MDSNVKKVIDYALDCIEKDNCLPTDKQTATALGLDESEVAQIKQDSEYIKFKALRDGYTSFEKECKDGFKGFRAFYYLYLAQRGTK